MSRPGWYPIALSADIEPATAAGTRLFGREVVVWRDDEGRVHVWEDRCPHRGMRLSFGFVRGSRLACLYHGWQFDPAGRCRYIPAHPALDVPPTITVTSFGSAERLGIIWMGLGANGVEGGPPGDEPVLPVRSLAVEASAAHVVAALREAPSPFAEAATLDDAGSLVTLRAGPACLHVAVQPVAEAETTLHLTVGTAAALDRKAVSLWAEDLRRRLEAAALAAGQAA